jgi:uncharacterized membrane protein
MHFRTQEQRIAVQALLVGITIYVALRFLVPPALDSNLRSIIGAAIAFAASLIISRVLLPRKP